MPITVDEAPAIFAQALKLYQTAITTIDAIKKAPTPLTAVSLCQALGIPAGTPLYVLAETGDLIAKDIAT